MRKKVDSPHPPAPSLWLLSCGPRGSRAAPARPPAREPRVSLCVRSCPALCSLMDCSPPGSSLHGTAQARTLEGGCHLLLQGIFLTQGSNLHWQVDSSPLCGGPGVKFWPTSNTQGMTEVRQHHAGSFSTSQINWKVLQQGKQGWAFYWITAMERSKGPWRRTLPFLWVAVTESSEAAGWRCRFLSVVTMGCVPSCIPSPFLISVHTPSLSTRLPRTEN